MNLLPGLYVLELEFSRPVARDVLSRVLTNAGFSQLSFDESLPEAAATFGATIMAASTATAAAAPRTMIAIAPSTTFQQVAAPTRAVALAASPVAPPPPPPPAAMPPIFKPPPPVYSVERGIMIQPGGMQQAAPVFRTPIVAVQKPPPPPSPGAPGGPSLTPARPGGVFAPPQESTPGPDPGAAPAPTEEAIYPTAAAYSPPTITPGETDRAAMPPDPAAETPLLAAVQDLWRRWAEWGSPFATAPMSVSGSTSNLVRVLARLDRPVVLSDGEAFRWVWVAPLLTNPFADLNLAFVMHLLAPGVTYELRFIARDKSAPTREAVRDMIEKMGFSVRKVHALKRNMRIPGRPATSHTVWWSVATWRGPHGPIVIDDPLFFETVAATANS